MSQVAQLVALYNGSPRTLVTMTADHTGPVMKTEGKGSGHTKQRLGGQVGSKKDVSAAFSSPHRQETASEEVAASLQEDECLNAMWTCGQGCESVRSG